MRCRLRREVAPVECRFEQPKTYFATQGNRSGIG